MDDLTLERVARRAAARPEFLAFVLDRYVQLCGPAAGGLPEHLAVSPRDFLRLGLCLRPRGDHFEADVRQIAGEFGIDPSGLADVVRFVDVAEAMSGGNVTAASHPNSLPGYLVAARARKPGGEGSDP